MDFRERVRGCWLGKCVGGAVGMPFEGVPWRPDLDPRNVEIVADVPNDDLEMQLLWLVAFEEHGVRLDHAALADVWRRRIPAGCDEYCVALRNLRHGVRPPASGWLDNMFADGMGATIRSEIWAAACAGRPDAAAHFAALDASVDHWGDGVWGAVFMALAECRAFGGASVIDSLSYALDRLPADTRTARTLRTVFGLRAEGLDAGAAGRRLRELFYSYNFTDAPMNLAYAVYGLLWGGGDFAASVVLAVNMGRDTDCTAAGVGAFLGIVGGAAAIPADWRARVADELSLSGYVRDAPGTPKTLSATIDRTVALHEKLAPRLPAAEYPLHRPYEPTGKEPRIHPSRWLVLDPALHDTAAIGDALRRTGVCPTELVDADRVIETGALAFDLSSFARGANTLELHTFLTVRRPPEWTVISATADAGMTLYFDGARIMNHHSRLPMLASFHRAEGGGAFSWRFRDGERIHVQIRLHFCRAPLRCALMFGGLDNNHLDGFSLTMPLAERAVSTPELAAVAP